MEEQEHAKNLVNNHDSSLIANGGTLLGAIDAALDWFGSNLQCCLPVKITAYSRTRRIATVAPLVKALTREGGFCTAESFSVQTFQYAANGFVIDFPIRVGDVGWVVASDRYTRNVKETHKLSYLEDINTHRYSSGFFIPDYYGVLMNYKRENNLNPYLQSDGTTTEDNRLVISSFDGKQKISIGRAQQDGEDIGGTTGDIKITSYTDADNITKATIKHGTINLTNSKGTDGTTTVTISGGTVTVVASKEVDVTTPLAEVHAPTVKIDGGSGNSAVSITGTLTVTGNITSSGGDVIASKKYTLNTHYHTGDGGPAVGPTSPPIG